MNMRKRIVIAGAGQMGRAALALLNRDRYDALAFADNDTGRRGESCGGLPVLGMEEALALAPAGVLIAVAGAERAREMEAQIRALGFAGDVAHIGYYLQRLDIRAAVLTRLAERLRDVPGDMAELGVYKGAFAARMNALFPERRLYLFDTFEGFDSRDTALEAAYSGARAGDFSDASARAVVSRLPHPEQAALRAGYFPDTAAGLDARFALVSLDADLYAPTLAGLRFFYPRMESGGVILLHDLYSGRFRGVRAAFERFEAETGRLLLLPVADAHGSAMLLRP